MNERLKHRLLGAAILLALVVLLLPGFLRDKENYNVNTDSQIPPKPSITAVDFDGPTPVDDVEPAPNPESMFLPTQEAPTIVDTVQEQAVSSAATSSESLIPDAWVIQVASLGQKEAAEKLISDLQAEGQKAYMRSIVLDKGTMHRVFIGPKMNRQDAEAIKLLVDKQFHVQSKIYRFKP